MWVATEPAPLAWTLHTAMGESLEPPIDGAAWQAAWAALVASRLPSLAAHLMGSRLASLPHEIRFLFEAWSLDAEATADRSAAQLGEVAGVLEETGALWVALKSWPLAARLYPTPACRPSCDLDLLVLPETMASIAIGLGKIGYIPTGQAHSNHQRYERPGGSGSDAIELHQAAGPPEFGGPPTRAILDSRQPFESTVGTVWVPEAGVERDLLIRHYLRHGGCQAILLLDLLLHLRGERYSHPLGAFIGDDLVRLGFPRTIDGPRRPRHIVLRRWMAGKDYETRRSSRHGSMVGVPLALSRSPLTMIQALARVVWPRHPTPRWRDPHDPSKGTVLWRLRRLASLGR